MSAFPEQCVVVGDRLLIKPKSDDTQTTSGLYLPPGVREKDQIRSGWVIKTGPGYAIPSQADVDEPWKKSIADPVRYIPLQAKVGDLALYLQAAAWEIEWDGEKYVIAPQSSVLMLIRDEELFD